MPTETKQLSDTLSALLYREQEVQNAARKISKVLDPLSSETQRAVLDLLNRAYTAQNPPKPTMPMALK